MLCMDAIYSSSRIRTVHLCCLPGWLTGWRCGEAQRSKRCVMYCKLLLGERPTTTTKPSREMEVVIIFTNCIL